MCVPSPGCIWCCDPTAASLTAGTAVTSVRLASEANEVDAFRAAVSGCVRPASTRMAVGAACGTRAAVTSLPMGVIIWRAACVRRTPRRSAAAKATPPVDGREAMDDWNLFVFQIPKSPPSTPPEALKSPRHQLDVVENLFAFQIPKSPPSTPPLRLASPLRNAFPPVWTGFWAPPTANQPAQDQAPIRHP